MPRVTLSKITPKGPYPTYPVAADSLDVTMTPADVANMEQFVPSGDDLILAHNSGASPNTITITSAADPRNGRTGDITTYSLGAGEIAAFRVKKRGWTQTDGRVYINASNTAVRWAVIQLAP